MRNTSKVFFNILYLQRLHHLGIETLELTRIKPDAFCIYKIIKNYKEECVINDFFAYNHMITHADNFKLNIQYSRFKCGEHSFLNIAVPSWTNYDDNKVICEIFQKIKRERNICIFKRFQRRRTNPLYVGYM